MRVLLNAHPPLVMTHRRGNGVSRGTVTTRCATNGNRDDSWFARRVRPRLDQIERHKKANWIRIIEFVNRMGREDARFLHERAEEVSDDVRENLNHWCVSTTTITDDDVNDFPTKKRIDDDDDELRL